MEVKKTYSHIPYEPKLWRQGKNLPEIQGIVVGGKFSHGGVTALIDPGDIHLLMIGAAGVSKTANFLYPCIEYACASGMSFLCTDTKETCSETMQGLQKNTMATRYPSWICESYPVRWRQYPWVW